MATILTERGYPGEAVLSEAHGMRSRDQIVIAENQDLQANQIIAKVAVAAPAVVSAVAGVNTGNGILTVANPAATVAAKPGTYKLTCIEPAANAGTFLLTDPEGVPVDDITVGVAYNGVLKFTLADGATDFVAGDAFNLAVATPDYRWLALNPAGVDGSQVAAGMLFDAVKTGAGQTAKATGFTRSCELNDKAIYWAPLNAGQKTTARAELAKLGIIVRQ